MVEAQRREREAWQKRRVIHPAGPLEPPWEDQDMWRELAYQLHQNEAQSTDDDWDDDPFGFGPDACPTLREYEVLEIYEHEGLRVMETSSDPEPKCRLWIPEAAECFTVGQRFNLGWNDTSVGVWPPAGDGVTPTAPSGVAFRWAPGSS